MVVRDWLSSALNDIMNCKKVGKTETVVYPVSKLMLNVFNIMKKEGYIKQIVEEKISNNTKVKLKIGNLNECRTIKPRFMVKSKHYDKYIRRFLPSRNTGIIIVSTNKGLMTHYDAVSNNLGGVLIAYCY